MNILSNVENVFAEKGIKYLKGNNSNSNILNVPYRGINNKNNHINIYMDIDEEQQVIKFTFEGKANNNHEISDIKSKLLDINATLNFGNLSMRNDSDTIEYRIDYKVEKDSFSFDEYKKNIIRCINVYENLKENDLI